MLNAYNMNLNLIRTFVVVGQSKDLKTAASKLELDISGVSRNITALEKLFQQKLVVRNKKNIELTEQGKILFEGYEKAYNMIFLAEKNLLQSQSLNSAKISIGIEYNLEMDLLNTKIQEFKEKYPNVIFKVINLPINNLFEKLEQYSLDFVIGESFENKRKSVEISELDIFEEEYCLAYLKGKFDLKDLSNIPYILPASSIKERKLLEQIVGKNIIQKNVSIEVCNYYVAKDYAESGLGVALLPKRIAKDSKLEIENININKTIKISYISENLTASTQEFLKLFKK